jgi:hypothetical protein
MRANRRQFSVPKPGQMSREGSMKEKSKTKQRFVLKGGLRDSC